MRAYNTAISASKNVAQFRAIVSQSVPAEGLAAGKEIDRANRGFYRTEYARLSLPGEYRALAAEQGIYSLPADLGSEPVAAVWCICRPNGLVERYFYPISIDQHVAAIKALAFCGDRWAERAWMTPVCQSDHAHGYFMLVDFLEVRP